MEQKFRKALESYLDCKECDSKGYILKRMFMKTGEDVVSYPCPRCSKARETLK